MPLMHAGTGDGVIGAIMHDLGVEDEASLTQVAINVGGSLGFVVADCLCRTGAVGGR